VDLWQTLRDRLDYATFVPAPVAGIERADLRRRDGSPYTMLKNPHGDNGAGRYLRLDPADVQLFELMDGHRTIQDVLVAHLESAGVFAIDRLARLTASLRVNGFFGEEPLVAVKVAVNLLGVTRVCVVQHTDCALVGTTDDEIREARWKFPLVLEEY